MSYRWRSSCKTNTGRVRRVNEDAFLDLDDTGLWVVADGMGGHTRGDVASRLIIEAFSNMERPASIMEFAAEVRDRLKLAHRRIKQESRRDGLDQIMGSTVVVLLVFKRQWMCLWAGDSRAYLLRDSVLQRITKDHSVAQELVDLGEIHSEEMDTHPYANHITRAVGANLELVLDERSSDLRDGDAILLCSDGLNKELSEPEIAAVLDNFDCNEAAQELIDLSLEHGGRDNVTVALIRFEEITGFSEPASDDTVVNYQILHNNLGVAHNGNCMHIACSWNRNSHRIC